MYSTYNQMSTFVPLSTGLRSLYGIWHICLLRFSPPHLKKALSYRSVLNRHVVVVLLLFFFRNNPNLIFLLLFLFVPASPRATLPPEAPPPPPPPSSSPPQVAVGPNSFFFWMQYVLEFRGNQGLFGFVFYTFYLHLFVSYLVRTFSLIIVPPPTPRMGTPGVPKIILA